jgi:hypothetical protein
MWACLSVRRRLRDELDVWQRAIELYTDTMGIKLPEPVPGQLTGLLDPSDAAVPDLVAHYMAERGRRGRIREVANWLVTIGKFPEETAKSGQLYGQVYTAILRHPDRFVKESPGTFRLAAGA